MSTKLARFSTDYSLVLEVKNDKGQLIDKAESVPSFFFVLKNRTVTNNNEKINILTGPAH